MEPFKTWNQSKSIEVYESRDFSQRCSLVSKNVLEITIYNLIVEEETIINLIPRFIPQAFVVDTDFLIVRKHNTYIFISGDIVKCILVFQIVNDRPKFLCIVLSNID